MTTREERDALRVSLQTRPLTDPSLVLALLDQIDLAVEILRSAPRPVDGPSLALRVLEGEGE